MANSPSSTITRKIDLTTEAVVCRPERLGAALDAQALRAGDDADRQRHERRLDHADLEVRDRDRLPEPRREDLGAHAAVEPGDQPAAVERRHRAEERQHRQGDDEREHARQDQHLDGIEPHGAQGVDLLAHLHGAELGRVGAARASRHHDRHDQHADLAQHQDADHVDHVLVGAELAEMEEALLGDDAADQEGDEQHDRHGLPADAVEVVHDGGDAQGLRLPQRRRPGHGRWRPASPRTRRGCGRSPPFRGRRPRAPAASGSRQAAGRAACGWRGAPPRAGRDSGRAGPEPRDLRRAPSRSASAAPAARRHRCRTPRRPPCGWRRRVPAGPARRPPRSAARGPWHGGPSRSPPRRARDAHRARCSPAAVLGSKRSPRQRRRHLAGRMIDLRIASVH